MPYRKSKGWGLYKPGPEVTLSGHTSAQGLTAYFPFREGSGTSISDAGVSAIKGTLTGATSSDIGWSGFVRNGTYGSCPNLIVAGNANIALSSSIVMNAPKAVAFWVNFSAAPSYAIIGGASPQYYPFIDGTNIYVRDGVGQSTLAHNGINTNQWYHFAVSGDGTTATVYKNGLLLGTFTDRTPTVDSIGAFDSGFSSGMQGLIDDVRIYKRLLLPNEPLEMFTNTYGVFSAPRRRIISGTAVAAALGNYAYNFAGVCAVGH